MIPLTCRRTRLMYVDPMTPISAPRIEPMMDQFLVRSALVLSFSWLSLTATENKANFSLSEVSAFSYAVLRRRSSWNQRPHEGRFNLAKTEQFDIDALHLQICQHVVRPFLNFTSPSVWANLKEFVLQRGQLQVVSLLSRNSVKPVSDFLQPDLQGLKADVSLTDHPSGHHKRWFGLQASARLRHMQKSNLLFKR